MALSSNTRQRVKALVDQLPDSSLEQAIALLETLQSQSSNLASPSGSNQADEEALLNIVRWQLPPQEQTRLDSLRQCNETATITAEEHHELVAYVERIEHRDAQRAAALIELAQLRQVPLEVVLTEFLPADVA